MSASTHTYTHEWRIIIGHTRFVTMKTLASSTRIGLPRLEMHPSLFFVVFETEREKKEDRRKHNINSKKVGMGS